MLLPIFVILSLSLLQSSASTSSELDAMLTDILGASDTIPLTNLNTFIDKLFVNFGCDAHHDCSYTKCLAPSVEAHYSKKGSVSQSQFLKLSPIIAYILQNPLHICEDIRNISDFEWFYGQLALAYPDGGFSEQDLDKVLHNIYLHMTLNYTYMCVSAKDLFEVFDWKERFLNDLIIQRIFTTVLLLVAQGHCVGNQKTLPPEGYFSKILFAHFGKNRISLSEFDHLYDELTQKSDVVHGSADDTHHMHKRHTKAAINLTSLFHEEPFEHQLESYIENPSLKCFTANQVLQYSQLNHAPSLGIKEIQRVCPALLQQTLANTLHECIVDEPHQEPSSHLQSIILGTISILIISLMSLCGILLTLFKDVHIRELVLQCFVGLAVSSLSGDALLHLLPQALGLHNHDGSEPGHHDATYVWRIVAAIFALYLFLLFEIVMHSSVDTHHHIRRSDSSKSSSTTGQNLDEHGEDLISSNLENGRHRMYQQVPDSTPELIISQPIIEDHTMERANVRFQPVESFTKADKQTVHAKLVRHIRTFAKTHCGIPRSKFAMVMMIMMGDAIHNLSDGLAVGAAFSHGFSAGFSTSLAVLFHEIPHELGDFAVLLECGVPLRTILLFCLLSSIFSFVGLYIGIAASVLEGSKEWIFAITAGMFLYVSLVDMLPQMMYCSSAKHKKLLFVLQNIGLLSGWGIMLLIALYEDHLAVLFA